MNVPSAGNKGLREKSEVFEDKAGLDRIVFFSDAVMAIAITLLVLDIRLPENPGVDTARRFLMIWPKFYSYILSFVVIGIYWEVHHRTFRGIRRYDRRLIWQNFLFLIFIGFLPFPTSLISSHPNDQAALTLYAAVAAGAGLSMTWIWHYAYANGHLVDVLLSRAEMRAHLRRSLLPPLMFIASVAIAFIKPGFAYAVWYAILLLPLTNRWRHRDRAPSPAKLRPAAGGTAPRD